VARRRRTTKRPHQYDPEHAACRSCATARRRHAADIAAAVREVHAASLRNQSAPRVDGGPDKQKTPGLAGLEVFTDPTPVLADGMVARDQCATESA
jgi:hypothetical protein